MPKKPLDILEASEPFQVTDKETGVPVNDVIYRMVIEMHRDGRKRRVLRGRDLSALLAFERSRLKYPNAFRALAQS